MRPETLVRLCVTLATVAASCDAFGAQGRHDLIQEYGKYTILEKCLGEGTLFQWYKWLDHMSAECMAEAGFFKGKSDKAGNHTETRGSDADTEKVEKAQEKEAGGEVAWPAEKIRFIMGMYLGKKKFSSCIMDKMQISMRDDGSIDTTPSVEYISALGLDNYLEQDLIKGIEFCAAEAVRLRRDDPRDITVIDPAYYIKRDYLDCTMEQRLLSCMRHDIRNVTDQYQLSGLDGLLDGLPEDEDKILTIFTVSTQLCFDRFIT